MSKNWHSEFLNITWNQYRELVFKLGQKVKRGGKNFDLIVTIARGGLALAHLLSDQLNLPVASFTSKSYFDLKQKKLPEITFGLSASLKNKKVLLVDEVSDTGKTFIQGVSYLQKLGAKKTSITTCCLHHKPHSKHKPDYYISSTCKWIIYPTEVFETMQALFPKWQKQKVGDEEIKKRFLLLKFPKEQVEGFLKT